MPKYCVARREVHISFVTIEADTAEQAKELVADCEGESMDYLEYSHTLDPDSWTVDEVKE